LPCCSSAASTPPPAAAAAPAPPSEPATPPCAPPPPRPLGRRVNNARVWCRCPTCCVSPPTRFDDGTRAAVPVRPDERPGGAVRAHAHWPATRGYLVRVPLCPRSHAHVATLTATAGTRLSWSLARSTSLTAVALSAPSRYAPPAVLLAPVVAYPSLPCRLRFPLRAARALARRCGCVSSERRRCRPTCSRRTWTAWPRRRSGPVATICSSATATTFPMRPPSSWSATASPTISFACPRTCSTRTPAVHTHRDTLAYLHTHREKEMQKDRLVSLGTH
jgi:hypothetical protein